MTLYVHLDIVHNYLICETNLTTFNLGILGSLKYTKMTLFTNS